MQFPMRDAMTPEEAATNAAAANSLVRGHYYRFEPPTTATAIPTGGPTVCALVECTFDRGWYLGFIDGNHVFQGKPVNDERQIDAPSGYEDALDLDDILERLRDSYFAVLFIGGSVAIPDDEPQDDLVLA